MSFGEVERMMHTFTYDGEEVFFDSVEGDLIATNWIKGQFYETKLLEKIKSMNLNGTYVDVGAHHGNHAIYFSKFTLAERVVAIEGNPINFDYLERNIKLNFCDIEAHNVLASNTDGEVKDMYSQDGNTGNTSIFYDEITGSKVKITEGITTQMDDILKNEKKVSLIKLDIQDSEWFALDGCRKIIEKHRPVIILEWNESNKEIDNLIDFFNEYGYEFSEKMRVPSMIHIYKWER
tara:strand:+ start:1726 stop:2430 length:705 start_codon:yes stop_codon:yes gene_type:complete